MADNQTNKEFYKTADSFIDVANNHCDNQQASQVGSALLYATARFSSFVVASHAKDQESYEAEIENALEFFTSEFKRMLGENLEEYKSVFAGQAKKPKYDHLRKPD